MNLHLLLRLAEMAALVCATGPAWVYGVATGIPDTKRGGQ